MNLAAPSEPISETRSWRVWAARMGDLMNGLTQSGTTAQRPTKGLYVGRMYFDTSLASGAGKPIWYNGSGWVDATGTSV